MAVEKMTSYKRRVKRLRENYLKQVAERETREKKESKKSSSITELNVEPAIDFIKKTDNKEQIAVWYEQESQNSKPRKTVIDALEGKTKEIENDNGQEGDE